MTGRPRGTDHDMTHEPAPHDQDAEPPTSDGEEPDSDQLDPDSEPASDPDPDPGISRDQQGSGA